MGKANRESERGPCRRHERRECRETNLQIQRTPLVRLQAGAPPEEIFRDRVFLLRLRSRRPVREIGKARPLVRARIPLSRDASRWPRLSAFDGFPASRALRAALACR